MIPNGEIRIRNISFNTTNMTKMQNITTSNQYGNKGPNLCKNVIKRNKKQKF